MNRNQEIHSAIIVQLFLAIRPKFYVELGIYQGQTIDPLASMFAGECRFIGVDRSAPRTPVPNIEYFIKDIDAFLDEDLQGLGRPDFVFVDADHTKEATERWFRKLLPLCQTDAMILFHDTNPETDADRSPDRCGDGEDFAKTLGNAVTLPYHPGLTIARVA